MLAIIYMIYSWSDQAIQEPIKEKGMLGSSILYIYQRERLMAYSQVASNYKDQYSLDLKDP